MIRFNPIWRFPKMVLPQISYVLLGFSIMGYLHLWKPPYVPWGVIDFESHETSPIKRD